MNKTEDQIHHAAQTYADGFNTSGSAMEWQAAYYGFCAGYEKASQLPVEVERWVSTDERIPPMRKEVLCLTRDFRSKVVRDWEPHIDQDDVWFKKTFSHWIDCVPSAPSIQDNNVK